MDDAFARTNVWNVSFKFKPPRDGIKNPEFIAVMNAIQEQGWRPALSQPDERGWYTVTCERVEAERADLAEAVVQSVALSAMSRPRCSDYFDVTQIDTLVDGTSVGGTWTGSGSGDDFTVGP